MIFSKKNINKLNLEYVNGNDSFRKGFAVSIEKLENEIKIYEVLKKSNFILIDIRNILGIEIITENEILNAYEKEEEIVKNIFIGNLSQSISAKSNLIHRKKGDKIKYLSLNYIEEEKIKYIAFKVIGASINIDAFLDNLKHDSLYKGDYERIKMYTMKNNKDYSNDKMLYVRKRLSEMGMLDTFGTKKEIAELPKILKDNETLEYITSGFLDGNTWLIACTNKRIILLDKGMIYGLSQKEIPLSKINSIQQSRGLVLGSIEIWDGASNIKIENINNESIGTMIDIINKNINKNKENNGNINNRISISDELEKLVNLREKGILTDEEFKQAKLKLLN